MRELRSFIHLGLHDGKDPTVLIEGTEPGAVIVTISAEQAQVVFSGPADVLRVWLKTLGEKVADHLDTRHMVALCVDRCDDGFHWAPCPQAETIAEASGW